MNCEQVCARSCTVVLPTASSSCVTRMSARSIPLIHDSNERPQSAANLRPHPSILKSNEPNMHFSDVRLSLPNDWVDVSEDLPGETPPPLANPEESPDDLDALLKEFAETRSLGKALSVERGKSASHYVGGTFLHGDD